MGVIIQHHTESNVQEVIKVDGTLTRNHPLHYDRIHRLQELYHSP